MRKSRTNWIWMPNLKPQQSPENRSIESRTFDKGQTTEARYRVRVIQNQLQQFIVYNFEFETLKLKGWEKEKHYLNHQITRRKEMRINIDRGETTIDERIRARRNRQIQARSKQRREIKDIAVVKARGSLLERRNQAILMNRERHRA